MCFYMIHVGIVNFMFFMWKWWKMRFFFLSFDYFFFTSQTAKMLYKLQKNIYAVYENGTISKSTVCKWNITFSGNFDRETQEHCDRLAAIDDVQIKMLIKIIQVIWHGTSQRYSAYLIQALQSMWRYGLISESLSYLGVSWFNGKIFKGPHFYLWFSAEMQQNDLFVKRTIACNVKLIVYKWRERYPRKNDIRHC